MEFLTSRPRDRPLLDSQTKDRLKLAKRTLFTTVTPLPPDVSRTVVLDFLHNHSAMIDLNPLVIERHPIPAPSTAEFDEQNCVWYSMTDKIDYLPGGKISGDISYTCAFHDLADGLQTHCRAPLGVDIRDRWTLNGSMPGEDLSAVSSSASLRTPPAKGAPASGLYIREDVDLRCNILMTAFIKKNLKRSHAALVAQLVTHARLAEAHPSTVETTASFGTASSDATTDLPAMPITPLKHSTTATSESSSRVSASDFDYFNPQHAIHRKPLSGTSTPPPPSPRTSSPIQEHTATPPASAAAAPPSLPPVAVTPPPRAGVCQDSVQAAVHAHLYSPYPSARRAPVQTPPYQTGRDSPVPQPHHHRLSMSGVPSPLRLRGSSVGSASSLNPDHHHQQQQQHAASYMYSLAPSLQSVATWDSTTTSHSSRPTSYSSSTNEYPLHTTTNLPHFHHHHQQQQQEYSPTEASSSSPEDFGPRTPPTYPQVAQKPRAHSSMQKASLDSISDFPAVLRPGSGCATAKGPHGEFGFEARLNGPFIAELD